MPAASSRPSPSLPLLPSGPGGVRDVSPREDQYDHQKSYWDRVDQVRNHYEKGGPFEMESIYFPNNDEEYYLQGWRAKDYESSKLWIKYFNDNFCQNIFISS